MNFVAGVLDGALVVHTDDVTQRDERSGATPATIEGEACPGWLQVPAASVTAPAELATWIGRGIAAARARSHRVRVALPPELDVEVDLWPLDR